MSWQRVLDAAVAETGIETLARRTVAAQARDWPVLQEDADLRELAERSAAANITLVMDLVRGVASAEPPPQATAFARELARRNLPMTALARSYRVGQRLLWRFGVAALREALEDPAAEIEAYTDATFATGEALMGGALERYAEERERWMRSADAVRRATVERLLAGEAVDVATAGARLGYELRRTHVGFVVWGEGALESAALAVGGPGALVAPVSPSVMAGWCAPEALTDPGPGVAVGTPGEGVEGFRRTHHEALEARRVARLGGLAGPVRYADVALVALLTTDLDAARTFAARELGELAEVPHLVETAAAVLAAQGSPTHAAQALGLHPNTVAKRVRAAEERLGRPLDARPAETLAALIIQRTVTSSVPAASSTTPERRARSIGR